MIKKGFLVDENISVGLVNMIYIFRLVKGDKNNLKKDVTIYSKMGGSIYTLYATDDLINFIEKTRMSQKNAENMIKKVDDYIAKTHSGCPSTFFVFKNRISSKSEKELLNAPENVAFAGEYSNVYDCKMSLEAGIKTYMERLKDQMRENNLIIEQYPFQDHKGFGGINVVYH